MVTFWLFTVHSAVRLYMIIVPKRVFARCIASKSAALRVFQVTVGAIASSLPRRMVLPMARPIGVIVPEEPPIGVIVPEEPPVEESHEVTRRL